VEIYRTKEVLFAHDALFLICVDSHWRLRQTGGSWSHSALGASNGALPDPRATLWGGVQMKKLALNKETLRILEEPSLEVVMGGGVVRDSQPTCYLPSRPCVD